jgi:hypothetical protein
MIFCAEPFFCVASCPGEQLYEHKILEKIMKICACLLTHHCKYLSIILSRPHNITSHLHVHLNWRTGFYACIRRWHAQQSAGVPTAAEFITPQTDVSSLTLTPSSVVNHHHHHLAIWKLALLVLGQVGEQVIYMQT